MRIRAGKTLHVDVELVGMALCVYGGYWCSQGRAADQ